MPKVHWTIDVANQGSGLKHSFHVELVGGGRHAQLNASMVLRLAVFVCLFITTMAKSVQTSLDGSLASQSFDEFWSFLYREAESLCTPVQGLGDNSSFPPISNHMDKNSLLPSCSVGPNSHSQFYSRLSTTGLSTTVRAEGSQCVLPHCGKSSGSLGESLKHSSSFRKSSWRRAVWRAAKFGKALYRGRWFRFHSLSYADKQVISARLLRHQLHGCKEGHDPSKQVCDQTLQGRVSKSEVASNQLSYASVNVGGLSAGKFDEAMQHASSIGLSVLCMQETRCANSKTWNSGSYAVVHSGEDTSAQSYAGILVAVYDPLDLRYDAVLGGRLLRVQFRTKTWALKIEIVCAYVPPLDGNNSSEKRLAQRQEIWTCLDRILSDIPQRHLLLLMGDFNTRLPRQVPEIPCEDPSHRFSLDHADVLALLLRHRLTIQNSRAGRAG